MYTKGYCKLNVFTWNLGDCSTCIPVEQSLVDTFYTENHKSKDGKDSVSFHDPIRMLFNQERLDQLGTAAVQKWLQSLNMAKSSPINELRQQCDDKMLIELIKSRHIQSMSELSNWAKHCKENLDSFKSEVAVLIAQKQAEEAERQAQEQANVETQQKSVESVNI